VVPKPNAGIKVTSHLMDWYDQKEQNFKESALAQQQSVLAGPLSS
jgi:hypothetical protein